MSASRKLSFVRASVMAVLMAFFAGVQAQPMSIGHPDEKEVSVTIDDLPLNGPEIGLMRLRAMTGKLLSVIGKNRMPVVGFVNESLLYVPGETDARTAVLKSWPDAGAELGNHTFSHLRFKDVTLAEYQADFVRGEIVTKSLMKQNGQTPRFFRHPYLQMAGTPKLEGEFESFIASRGYKIAPVTIDILDWMFLSAYLHARAKGDAEMVRRVSVEYLKYAEIKIEFCEKAADELFGRQIPQILLLHANELNADNLDGLITLLRKRGYRFIALDRALKDPAYRFPDKYKDTSDWLSHWAFSLGKTINPPMPPEFVQKAFLSPQVDAVVPVPSKTNYR